MSSYQYCTGFAQDPIYGGMGLAVYDNDNSQCAQRETAQEFQNACTAQGYNDMYPIIKVDKEYGQVCYTVGSKYNMSKKGGICSSTYFPPGFQYCV